MLKFACIKKKTSHSNFALHYSRKQLAVLCQKVDILSISLKYDNDDTSISKNFLHDLEK